MSEEPTSIPDVKARKSSSFGHHALAALVLLVCAYLLFHLLFHVVIVIATIAAVVVAIIGVVWAAKVLF
jgi:Flp pilus assembly protein TadB